MIAYGLSLETCVYNHLFDNEQNLLRAFFQIGQSIFALHKSWIVHGNINAKNIILCHKRFKLTGLGSAVDLQFHTNRHILFDSPAANNPEFPAPEIRNTLDNARNGYRYSFACK